MTELAIGGPLVYSQQTSTSSLRRAPLGCSVQKGGSHKLARSPDAKSPAYFFESLDFPVTDRKMEAYYAEFPPDGAASEAHQHDGAELIYVLKGRLTVDVDGNKTTLGEGDAMYFDPAVPHSYEQDGRSMAAGVVVVP